MTPDRPAILGGAPLRPDGPPGWPPPDPAVDAALRLLIETGAWGRYHGPHGEALRAALSETHGGCGVHLCGGGTAAVELALIGVGVTAGDEVVLAGYDFRANPANVLALGAVPAVVDVRPDDWQIDPAAIRGALGPKTRAVLVSHLHGGVVALPAVRALCDEAGVALIEDACQNPGATVHGRPAGTWGDAGVLSFGGSKPLTAGRGGAVLFPANPAGERVAARIRRHVGRGNDLSPLSEMQAAVLVPQVRALAERTRLRSENGDTLRSLPGLTPLAPAASAEMTPGFYKMGFQYDPAAYDGLPRGMFCAALRAEGVAFDPGFPALRSLFSGRRARFVGDLPQAAAAGERCVGLHHPVLLAGGEDLAAIPAAVERVRTFAGEIVRTVPLPNGGESLEL
ncbi:DegT/DnrJ/EryC1/StrS family aminotransferase [Alienimonas californiensis]|uniref:L-glutamine:2-deoxy-scyllo-inosose aminotransferase n=1 Tax=Alienimonas californiensis TaxID=2527989 RepID=A0A517P4J9_9PLAN|nr:aminotransferase class V-fold PLP-dependent enzyme [Alienimonas californiensis]QDT14300.1 L-glutamine:2-deoxy-scyllo-inosose aminotransferase [Alienimonas californiensis]